MKWNNNSKNLWRISIGRYFFKNKERKGDIAMNMYDEIVKKEEKRLGVTRSVPTKKENKIYLVVNIDNEENECQFPLFGDFLKSEGESFNPENFYISVQELVNSLFAFEDADDLMAYEYLDKLIDLLEFTAIVFLDEYEERIHNDEVSILATDQDGTFNFSIKITSLSGLRTGVDVIDWRGVGIIRFSNEERE